MLSAADFDRTVREQAHLECAEVFEDLATEAVVALVCAQAEAMVGFHGIQTAILQFVGRASCSSARCRDPPDSGRGLRPCLLPAPSSWRGAVAYRNRSVTIRARRLWRIAKWTRTSTGSSGVIVPTTSAIPSCQSAVLS